MPRITLVAAASLVAVIALSACGAAANQPSASPSPAPASPSAAPTIVPPPSVTPPPATPAPTKSPVATPRPTEPGFNAAEHHLLDGVQRGDKDCRPASARDELPPHALAGIECKSSDPAVARVGFYLFANDEDMLDAYLFRMNAESVAIESGSCNEGESEHAYVPDEGFAFDRAGCFLNDEGFANYRFTMSGDHVYVGVLGRSADMLALEAFAWKGNEDMPGMPMLWFGGID